MSSVISNNNSTDSEKKGRTIRLGAIAPSRRERLKMEEAKLEQSEHTPGYVVELENHIHFKVLPACYSNFELFLVCDEDFPTEPPIVTVKKLIYGDGGKIVSRKQIPFESGVVANWNETCNLVMIVDEFVATRKTSLLTFFSTGNTGKVMRVGLGVFAIIALVTLAFVQNTNENVSGLYAVNQASINGSNSDNNPGVSGISTSGRGLADSGTLRGEKDEISEFTALFLESVFEYKAVAQGNDKTSGTVPQNNTATSTSTKTPTIEPGKSENIVINNKLGTVAADTDTPQAQTNPAQATTNQPTTKEDRTEAPPVSTTVPQGNSAAPVPTTLIVPTPSTPNITTAAPTTINAPAATTTVAPEPTTTTAAPTNTTSAPTTTAVTPEPTTTTAAPTTTNVPTTPAPTTSAPTTSAPTPTPTTTSNKGKDKTPKPTKTPKGK